MCSRGRRLSSEDRVVSLSAPSEVLVDIDVMLKP